MSKEQLRQYAVAVVWAVVVFAGLSYYLFLRRGYYDLFIANKVLAGVSLVLLGIVLLIGPFSRLFERLDPWVIYRKELGILALFLGLAHGLVSYFFLPQKFPLSYFQSHLLTFVLGLAGLIVLLFLFIISFERLIARMNREWWWWLQNWGVRLALILVFLHVVIMKYPGWIKWYSLGGGEELARPFMPPGSLIAGLFGSYVIFVRLTEFLGPKAARFFVVAGLVGVALAFFGSYQWGKIKTPQALPLKWETCVKLPGSKILQTFPEQCISPDGRVVRKTAGQ